ncbi:protein FAR1-RELATED SEQUENCE 5-like [Solanum verrucosum]|uniref:protein FAR1-RELATED SEQUENCE 5-like n=1 Tax=Solanum verrucosum TaxID=315347 RepID=UPI0020D0AFE9|nr:protein FAR1-RELATED SEQUENCE 5-like [Solanum verrucosum]
MNTTEVREELHRSLGMASDDSLMNENEWVDDDSYYSLNNDVRLDEDDEEVENNEEHILGDELEECDVNGEPYDTFTKEDASVGPISGMQFKDENYLFALYKEHARLKGFSIVKRNSKKIVGDTTKYLTYCCDRARNRKVKYTTKSNNCKARITAIVDSYGFWLVSKVFNEHNHELLPAIARLMAGHRSISQSLKRDLVAHDRSGIRPSKNIRLVEVQRGGPQNLGCTPKDCRNFILNSRNFEKQEGDAQSLLYFFHEMQIKDREFFYSIDIDNSGRLQNVVRVHSHCKAAYEHFHDAICFDTTYLVNRYSMPCASFDGINHHRQLILLGCALMSHEDIVSYKLIFRTWPEAMGNVHPNAIITDQCLSIKPAIAEVMPHIVHRYCIWHIYILKVAALLKWLPNSKIARGEFKYMILDSISVENFEIRWAEYIAKYDLQTRDWFNKLYIEKEKWVPAYLDVFFCDGMLSTQRSEGMHAFFDGFISHQSTLKLCVHQYELAIRATHEKELEAEYRSKGFHIISESLFKWEEHVIQCYTRTIYEFFKS